MTYAIVKEKVHQRIVHCHEIDYSNLWILRRHAFFNYYLFVAVATCIFLGAPLFTLIRKINILVSVVVVVEVVVVVVVVVVDVVVCPSVLKKNRYLLHKQHRNKNNETYLLP